MKELALKEVMTFTLGKNPTRLTEADGALITPDDLDGDLYSRHGDTDRACCIISLIKSTASPASDSTKEKCLTSNFLQCELNSKLIDGWYFCYKFNQSREFTQQIASVHQGTTTSVKKLTQRNIEELRITLPEIEKQRLLGDIYRQSLMQLDLMKKQTDQMGQLMFAAMEKMDE